MTDPVARFRGLALQAETILQTEFCTTAIEPLLGEMLALIKQNPGRREAFVQALISCLETGEAPLECAQFCMRELRWDEIRQWATKRSESADDPRVGAALRRVLDVYEDEWEDADLFEYYARK